MKKLIVFLSIVVLFTNCKNNSHRYTQNSKEIETVKTTINYYDYHQWDSLAFSYADTAKIYYNSRKHILAPSDLKTYFTRNSESFSTRAFEDESREYEMIEDNNGKRWVNFWGLWKGHLKANNKEIIIPVHITYQFEKGKIVTEFGYWNTGELEEELKIIASQKKVVEDTKEDVNKVIEEIEKIEDIEETD
ncbi:nuclear transport factor 2 family protein [uncultured Lacinutrix sp.]|uniref:nuclear transport factor 2 family protein n=1 Tax=uncultured Lacinutrix sp. TaxID=574032 RepID=UPI002638ED30|nr:nuclear transport factor 2 family protein [uncultured Lacinutrix sp.]